MKFEAEIHEFSSRESYRQELDKLKDQYSLKNPNFSSDEEALMKVKNHYSSPSVWKTAQDTKTVEFIGGCDEFLEYVRTGAQLGKF